MGHVLENPLRAGLAATAVVSILAVAFFAIRTVVRHRRAKRRARPAVWSVRECALILRIKQLVETAQQLAATNASLVRQRDTLARAASLNTALVALSGILTPHERAELLCRYHKQEIVFEAELPALLLAYGHRMRPEDRDMLLKLLRTNTSDDGHAFEKVRSLGEQLGGIDRFNAAPPVRATAAAPATSKKPSPGRRPPAMAATPPVEVPAPPPGVAPTSTAVPLMRAAGGVTDRARWPLQTPPVGNGTGLVLAITGTPAASTGNGATADATAQAKQQPGTDEDGDPETKEVPTPPVETSAEGVETAPAGPAEPAAEETDEATFIPLSNVSGITLNLQDGNLKYSLVVTPKEVRSLFPEGVPEKHEDRVETLETFVRERKSLPDTVVSSVVHAPEPNSAATPAAQPA